MESTSKSLMMRRCEGEDSDIPDTRHSLLLPDQQQEEEPSPMNNRDSIRGSIGGHWKEYEPFQESMYSISTLLVGDDGSAAATLDGQRRDSMVCISSTPSNREDWDPLIPPTLSGTNDTKSSSSSSFSSIRRGPDIMEASAASYSTWEVQSTPRRRRITRTRGGNSGVSSTRWRIGTRVLIGGLLGGLGTVCLMAMIHTWDPDVLTEWADFVELSLPGKSSICRTCNYRDKIRGRNNGQNGILSYLNLFQRPPLTGTDKRSNHSANVIRPGRRKLAGPGRWKLEAGSPSSSSTASASISSSSSSSTSSSSSSRSKSLEGSNDPHLVIAGKMAIADLPCNIGQYNLKAQKWSLEDCIQLSLYNSYSGGEVYSLLANHTNKRVRMDEAQQEQQQYGSSSTHPNTRPAEPPFEGSGELIVVGAFDTTYRNSQVTYCSVGKWDGVMLSKVGEGLCNSALSKGMKITTAALAGPQDVYVAGSFQTQVWNGDRHEFVKIYNIAHYNAVDQVWLPLNIGQITCSWCTVTVLALAWDSVRRQLHVAGKFNAIDGRNVPAGLAIYDLDSGHLVAHPGGGLSMSNITQDGVGTALQLDEESGVLYVMGSFERLTATSQVCYGLAAYEINTNRWTCLADSAHTVQPTGGGNMLLTPYGLMVAGKTSGNTTWTDDDRPYTIALLKATLRTHEVKQPASHGVEDVFVSLDDDYVGTKPSRPATSTAASSTAHSSTIENKSSSTGGGGGGSGSSSSSSSGSLSGGGSDAQSMTKQESYHEFDWSWLPGFRGHDEPLHALANGFGDHAGAVFIAGDNLVAKWSYQPYTGGSGDADHSKTFSSTSSSSSSQPKYVAVTENLSLDHVRGSIMAISQMMPETATTNQSTGSNKVNITIIIYCVAVGCVIGMLGAIMCNRNLSSSVFPCFDNETQLKGISLDTLTYSAMGHSNITDAYQRAMKTRYVQHPHLLTIIDPQEIFLQRIIGEGTFGRVWSARWRSASVAVKEFVFAQAAVAGKSSQQQEIVEEIIGEAGMMAILRHPNVLQLFGCSLTAQAIWIVSELCSLGSLRQVLDDNDRSLPVNVRLNLALQVAEGMTYLHNQDQPIIHRDLKSHNIFVHETFTDVDDVGDKTAVNGDKEGRKQRSLWSKPHKMTTHSTLVAKIGDWGSARATLSGSRTMTHGVGTACWLAPEVIKHARSSKYSDVYGYGIVLWELATREEVYQGLETTQIIAKVANESLRPPVPDDCPWRDIMVQCWAELPQDRLEFNEVVVELNRISREMEENRNRNVDEEDGNESGEIAASEYSVVVENSNEGSPLLGDATNNTTTESVQPPPNRRVGGLSTGLNLLSNVLRQARGE